jgi:hypothetical protein
VIISGTVTGKTGGGLVLLDNGGDDKLIASDGAFQFDTSLPMGSTYDVTVGTQPSNPSQMCTVTNGTGTANDNVTDIMVDCMAASYTVGGTLFGLPAAKSVTITDNGGNDLTLDTNGMFAFTQMIASGSPYLVEIKTQPSGTVCSVSAGMGIVGNDNVMTILVNCAMNTFTIGGVPPGGGVTGLDGTVKLLDNGTDMLSVAANGAFAFPTPIVGGGNNPYLVTVMTQPSYPPKSQTCMVMNGSGTVGTADITNVQIACSTNAFTIGGSISGLNGTITLKDNGGDATMISANGMFTFATPVASGSTYAVTVSTQPPGQLCTVTKGSGTVMNSNITTVVVTCGDPGVKCGSGYCIAGAQQCCDPEGTPQCIGIFSQCFRLSLPCDDKADCSGGKKCCATTHNGTGTVQTVSCSTTCGGSNPVQMCDPGVSGECSSGTCQAWGKLSGYNACL